METYHLKPQPGELERIRLRIEEAKVWWVEFSTPAERVFCRPEQVPTIINADYGITWAGVDTRHWPRQLPTDQEGVCCVEFGISIDRMAVEEQWMRGWMQIVRANGLHGKYRKAGTTREYEF